MENKIKGFIYGFAIGDAIGTPYEGYRRRVLQNTKIVPMKSGGFYQKEAGTFSDDSSLMLATLDSIARCKEIDFDDLMKSYLNWFFEGKYTTEEKSFGIKEVVFNAINKYKNGIDAILCGDDFEENSDISAIIRIVPICIYLYNKYGKEFYNDDDALFYLFGATELTNKQDTNLIGVIYLSVLISEIMQDKTLTESVDNAILFIRNEFKYEDSFSKFENLINIKLLKEENIISKNDIISILVAITYAFINKSNADEIAMFLIGLGGETDSYTSLGYGLSGLYYGFHKINKNWLEDLKGKELIKEITLKYIDILYGKNNYD